MDNFMFFRRIRKREVKTEGQAPTTNQGGSFEPKVRRPATPGAALTISAVYRAIELRAKTVGQFQMQYQMLNRDGGNFVQDVGSPLGSYASLGRKMNYLLQVSPNPVMSATQMMQQLVINKLQLGNAFIYIERDADYDPKYLWLATCGGYNQIANTYNLTYASDHGVVNIAAAPASDVIHIANTFRDKDGYMGIPTIRYALDTLSMIATQKAQSLDTAAKGGRMKLLVGEDSGTVTPIAKGLYDKGEMDAYAKEIENRVYGQDVVAMRALDKVTSISMSASDQQLIEMLNMSLDDVARFFGTPRPLLMMDSNSHYTTPTNATLEYMTRTIQPDVLEIEQEFTRKLLNVFDFGKFRFHMCEQPLLRLDKEAQAKVDTMRLQAGSATVNEIRKQYDMPAVDNGDIVYVSTNLAELGSDKLRSNGKPDTDVTGTVTEEKKGEE